MYLLYNNFIYSGKCLTKLNISCYFNNTLGFKAC